MSAHGFLRSVAAAPLFVVTHVFYGLGFWRGLFTSLQPKTRQAEVALEHVRW
jgi:hypothetical protein